MQASTWLVSRLGFNGSSLNVGGLMALCEENYVALMRLAPSLTQLSGCLSSRPEHRTELFLTVLEQSRYTTTLRLTHAFVGSAGGTQQWSEPDATLRTYHDAEQVEVLNLRQTVLPILSHYDTPALAAKWRANLFVSKWLRYCIGEGHHFTADGQALATAPGRELLPSA